MELVFGVVPQQGGRGLHASIRQGRKSLIERERLSREKKGRVSFMLGLYILPVKYKPNRSQLHVRKAAEKGYFTISKTQREKSYKATTFLTAVIKWANEIKKKYMGLKL